MQTVSFAGSNYAIPTVRGDTPWSGLSDFVIACAAKAINIGGGNFTLLADINFGATFGLVSSYFTSRSSNAASAGAVRLASTDTVKWRNNANGADIALDKDTSDNLRWNATKLLLSGAVVNADINASAAIAYSKLALTGSIVNADVSASAAIVYSKLSLTGSIVNADVSASAAIALSKLAAVTASRVLVSDASGFVSASSVTSTTLGYLDATSSIQTQLNAKVANPLTGNLAAGGNKITGLAAGSANGDALRYEQRPKAFCGSFAGAAGTGNQSITGVGFTPKVVMFFMGAISSGNNFITNGRMDDAGHQSVEMHAIGSGVNLNTQNTTACVGAQSNSSASYVSMDADGFTINWSSANSAFTYHFIALG